MHRKIDLLHTLDLYDCIGVKDKNTYLAWFGLRSKKEFYYSRVKVGRVDLNASQDASDPHLCV